ncbi:MAG TPA: hypothetical protein VFC98_05545 [Clostridia bacterium]|nr:hypothetical protein [Clostridia bacterium]
MVNKENTGKLKDITGIRFGKLIVLERSQSNSKSGNAMWVCRCDCGNITVVIGSKLRTGHTKSCGCLRTNNIAQGHSKERIYRIWKGMHQRCYNQKDDKYRWYGAKGILICPEWHKFIPFRKWALNNGYEKGLTIDRKNPNGNYEPANCRWQTQKQQMNNVSSNKNLLHKGKNYTQSEFAEKFNLKYHTVVNRLRLGWALERIINTPER